MGDKTNSAYRWKAITPGAGFIEPRPEAVYVGTGGNVVAEGDDGNAETFAAQDGDILPIQPRRITSATATGLIALYNT